MIIPPALCAETSPGPPNKLAPRYLSEASVSWYVCTVVWQSLRAQYREPQVVRTNPFSSFVGLLANKEFPRSPIRSRGGGGAGGGKGEGERRGGSCPSGVDVCRCLIHKPCSPEADSVPPYIHIHIHIHVYISHRKG